MVIKEGVKLAGLRPEMLVALMVANHVYASIGKNVVVTSVMDGKHSRGSLHYVGFAFDLRINSLTASEIKIVVHLLKLHLSSEFDVVLERTHIHVEFQPKV